MLCPAAMLRRPQLCAHIAAVLEFCHGKAARQPEAADIIKVGAPAPTQYTAHSNISTWAENTTQKEPALLPASRMTRWPLTSHSINDTTTGGLCDYPTVATARDGFIPGRLRVCRTSGVVATETRCWPSATVLDDKLTVDDTTTARLCDYPVPTA